MNRVALVTGASRGIGRAIAAELAEAGHAVCINYLTHRQEAETLAEKIRNHGGNAIAVQADVADRAAVETMVRTAEAELGPVSLLVNNAGIAGQIQFQDITDAQWNRYLGVNLGGARNTIQAVLPHMLHEKAGCIVNISSIWGLRGASCEVAYACTKAWRWSWRPPTSGSTAWLPASSTPTWFRFWDRRPCGIWRSRRLWDGWGRRRTWPTPLPFWPPTRHPSSRGKSSPPTAGSSFEDCRTREPGAASAAPGSPLRPPRQRQRVEDHPAEAGERPAAAGGEYHVRIGPRPV